MKIANSGTGYVRFLIASLISEFRLLVNWTSFIRSIFWEDA